ncbi:MAG TPA: TRAP transporter small permease subunit [Candidatus Atribacteria bacterium]|nr:TRAP transporter small permease subunit [Candidatus Atribacteria bacterium]
MAFLKKIVKTIDFISEQSGSLAKWFAWLLVLVGAYDTIMRHFFNAPTIWAYDTMCMAGGALYALGWSYDYLHDAHTRVDVFYTRLSPRNKAKLNLIASLFLFFPMMIALSITSTSWALRAWRIHETMISTFWYPPAAPYRTIFAIGIYLLILQGIANFLKDLYFIMRGEKLD